MAALHWEAQRKQGVIDKKHKYEMDRQEKLKLLQEQNQREIQESRATRQGSSYEKQLRKMIGQNDRCARGEYHQNRDVERRQAYHEATKGERNAKIPLRSNNITYSQQW